MKNIIDIFSNIIFDNNNLSSVFLNQNNLIISNFDDIYLNLINDNVMQSYHCNMSSLNINDIVKTNLYDNLLGLILYSVGILSDNSTNDTDECEILDVILHKKFFPLNISIIDNDNNVSCLSALIDNKCLYLGQDETTLLDTQITSLRDGCYSCNNIIENIKLTNNISYIGKDIFKNSVNLKNIDMQQLDYYDAIKESQFSNCISLSCVNLPINTKRIGYEAFLNCYSLSSIVLPNKQLTHLNGSCFFNCSSLISIDIPDTVTYIGDNAFGQCTSLHTIVLSKKINHINDSVFSKCDSLSILVIKNINEIVKFYPFIFQKIFVPSNLYDEYMNYYSSNYNDELIKTRFHMLSSYD